MCAAAPTLAGGCFPVPLELEEADAGPTSPPVIQSASPEELSFPGPIVLDQGDQRRLGLTIRDQDREDTLYIKLFVDYGITNTEKERQDCLVPPSGNELRISDCSISRVCNAALADGQEHYLEAMVADREFLPDNDPRTEGQPPFRALPQEAAFSFRAWLLRCNPEDPQ